MNSNTTGATLLELLLVLGLATLLSGSAVLGYRNIQENFLFESHLRSWFDALAFARSYALITRQTVGICPGGKPCDKAYDFARGWTIFAKNSGQVLAVSKPWKQAFSLSSKPAPPIYFNAEGRADTNRRFLFCFKHREQQMFLIRSGRLRHADKNESSACPQ